jgi:dTDP-4-amino-4,6-dideoxygalactose transaminase
VVGVLDTNWLTAGPKIAEFETLFSEALGQGVEAVALSSATAALHLSLIALNIQAGDEVIVPSLTFVACANAIRYVGATPVFADINSEQDWNISVTDIARKITTKTRAVMVVHYGGYACDMDAVMALCKAHSLKLIEDCSHAPLVTYRSQRLGTFGDTGCFSFFSNKNLTTGEGGMLATRDADIAARVRVLRSHGISTSTYQRFKGHAYGYDVTDLGYNYRLDEIRAAIGIEQLKKQADFTDDRRKIDARYRTLLAEKAPSIRIPFGNYVGDTCYHIFPVLVPGDRETIMHVLKEKGIQTSIHYKPIHAFTSYQSFAADVPITDRIAPSILSLPFFPTLTDAQMDMVIESLVQCLA